jgi:hypothetical protein
VVDSDWAAEDTLADGLRSDARAVSMAFGQIVFVSSTYGGHSSSSRLSGPDRRPLTSGTKRRQLL